MPKSIDELNSLTNLTGTEKLIARQGIDDGTITLSDVFNLVLPVGYEYIQTPGSSSPSTMGWLGTWSNVSSEYAGDFFRVEGGLAGAFGSGEQSDTFQGHKFTGSTNTDTHNHNIDARSPVAPGTAYSLFDHSAVAGRDTANTTKTDTIKNDSHSHTVTADSIVSDDVNGVPRTSSETRPVNRTIRVWRRTA